MWNGRCGPHSMDPESVRLEGPNGDGSHHERYVKGGMPGKETEGYGSGSEEGSVVLVEHIPEIGCSRAGHDGPKGGEPLRNAGHPKLKKKKAKNAKRFSDIAKINRHILQAARKAGKKLKSSSSNPMHIDNLISHEDETDKQPGDVDDNGLTDPPRLTRRAARTALQYLSQKLNSPINQLDSRLPCPKIYAYAPSLPSRHPGLDQLDILMIGWQNQQGAEGTVEKVGLELACAWILAQSEAHEPQHPHIEQRLIAALDKLAYE